MMESEKIGFEGLNLDERPSITKEKRPSESAAPKSSRSCRNSCCYMPQPMCNFNQSCCSPNFRPICCNNRMIVSCCRSFPFNNPHFCHCTSFGYNFNPYWCGGCHGGAPICSRKHSCKAEKEEEEEDEEGCECCKEGKCKCCKSGKKCGEEEEEEEEEEGDDKDEEKDEKDGKEKKDDDDDDGKKDGDDGDDNEGDEEEDA